MANTKVTSHVIANDAITADQLATAAVTHAKLHATMDLSGKTVTLPAVAIPSASTATTQSASDSTTKVATTAYVTTAISNLVDSAPAALDTLNEIAAALGDDANYASTTTAAIAAKLPLAGGTLTGNLVLSGAPSSGLHPATKTYTDTADALKLNLSGGTLTGDLILNTTTALKIPVGTTSQRPSAATGQLRWNTTDGALEVYNGSAWTAVGTGSSNKVLDTFTGNNSTTTFTLSVTPANEDAIMVFIDGAYQEKGDYVLTNNSLALGTAPLSGEKIAVHTTTASVHDGTSGLNNQFTATNGQTAFTLTQDPLSENNTQVYINGVYQQKTDYTVVGTTLTFDTGLTVGDVVEVNMFTVATLGNTDTMSEGVSNLYHTTARARSAISVSGNALSYNSSTGVITSSYEESPTFAALTVDNITIDGNEIDLSSGDLTLDVAGNIVLDADGGGVYFKDAGVNIGFLQNSGANDFRLVAGQADKDIVFMGNDSDGGGVFTALTLDMSEGGNAIFNKNISVGGSAYTTSTDLNLLGDGLSIKNDKAGSSNNWSLIQNTDTGSASNLSFTTGLGVALTLNHNKSATFGGDLSLANDLYIGNTTLTPSSNHNNQAGLGFDTSIAQLQIASTSNNAQMEISRNSSNDGNWITFRKQSNILGNLGTYGGTLYIGSANGGIMFNGTDIEPTTGAATRADNSIDLGSANHRFKDAFIGDGVYLGGTNAANKLDSYEEGNWNPVMGGDGANSGTQTYTGTYYGKYIKIGRLVTLYFDFQVTALGTTTGTYAVIKGFPFNVQQSHIGGGTFNYYSSLTGITEPLNCYVGSNETGYLMRGGATYVLRTALTANTRLMGQVSYYTNE